MEMGRLSPWGQKNAPERKTEEEKSQIETRKTCSLGAAQRFFFIIRGFPASPQCNFASFLSSACIFRFYLQAFFKHFNANSSYFKSQDLIESFFIFFGLSDILRR